MSLAALIIGTVILIFCYVASLSFLVRLQALTWFLLVSVNSVLDLATDKYISVTYFDVVTT